MIKEITLEEEVQEKEQSEDARHCCWKNFCHKG